MKRSRGAYLIAAILVVGLGLASRRYSSLLPGFVATYPGDILWALAAFLSLRIVFPKWRILSAAATALLFSVSIELSQLYHSPWIDQIRHTTLGGLVLGYGFLWTDLLCYFFGISVGVIVETLLRSGPVQK
jgi:hypothetical protein